MSVQILRVRMATNGGTHESIAELEWINRSDGSSGRSSREVLHDWLKNKGGSAYVNDNVGDVVSVYPRENQWGTRFVQTRADGIWKDNLTALPRY